MMLDLDNLIVDIANLSCKVFIIITRSIVPIGLIVVNLFVGQLGLTSADQMCS